MAEIETFDLNEECTIYFRLRAVGESNIPNVKPMIRFIISENSENGMAVVLPAQATEEGVAVTIPPLKHMFSEDKKYVGKLEIIVGNQYFAPTSMNMKFKEAFAMEAEVLKKEKQNTPQVESVKISKPSTAKKPTVVVKEEAEEKVSLDEISEEMLAGIETLEAPLVKKPLPNAPAVAKPAATETKKKPAYKEEFKNLLREAFLK